MYTCLFLKLKRYKNRLTYISNSPNILIFEIKKPQGPKILHLWEQNKNYCCNLARFLRDGDGKGIISEKMREFS